MISNKTKEKIKEIRELQFNNHMNSYFKYNSNIKFQKSNRPLSTDFNLMKNKINDNIFYSRLRNKNCQIYKNNSKIGSLFSNYKSFNPYVTMMMTNGANLTEYNHAKYVEYDPAQQTQEFSGNNLIKIQSKKPQTSKNKKRTFFGIDGKTKLENNFNNTSLKSLYMKTFSGAGTVCSSTSPRLNTAKNDKSSFFMPTVVNFTSEDQKYAENIFLDENRNKNNKVINKEDKKDFYGNYNISKKLTVEEETNIEKCFLENQKVNNNLNFNPIFRGINTEYNNLVTTRILKMDYKDPFKSLKKMKLNSQMCDLIQQMRINLQCQKYQNKYDNMCELNLEKNRMPNVRVFEKTKKKNLEILNNDDILKIFKVAAKKRKNKSHKTNKFSILNNDSLENINGLSGNTQTRSDKLQELKLDISFGCFGHHPELRTMNALAYNEENGTLYIHGGIGGKKYADFWDFCFSSEKVGWRRIYEPKDKYFDTEPLPRFGHTMHFYEGKIYLIGGEFDDWNNNYHHEGIMSIYDTNKKSWDMLKDDYDIYTIKEKIKENIKNKRKKEESQNIFDNNINYVTFANNLKNRNKFNNGIDNYSKNMQKYKITNQNNVNHKREYSCNTLSETSKNGTKIKLIKNHNNFNKKAKITSTKNILNEHNLIKIKNNSALSLQAKLNNQNIIEIEPEIKDEDIQHLLPQFPSLRRNHISLLIGNNIFVYGGINQNKTYLNDCWICDLNTRKWSILEFIGRYPPPLGHHCACLALEKSQFDIDQLTVYHKPMNERKTIPTLKTEGVFFFGGNNDNRIPTNLFFQMSVGIKPAMFEIPKTNGKPPSPRTDASMSFSSTISMIIIHGGKNEMKFEFYNDVFMLDLKTMDWIHPLFKDEIPLERAEHKSIAISDKLFILGGTTSDHFLNYDFTIINLNFFGS